MYKTHTKRRFCLGAALILVMPVAIGQSLNDAIQQALYSNPDVLFKTASQYSASYALQGAKSGWFPTVDLQAGIGKEQSYNPTTRGLQGVNGYRTLNRKESSIELRQRIFAGGAVVGEIQRNKERYIAEKFKVQGVAEDVAAETSERYLDVLKGQRHVNLARQNLNAHRAILKMIRERSTAGVSRKAELDQADGRLALAHANLISEQNNLKNARTGFIRVVGEPARNLLLPKEPGASVLPGSREQGVHMAIANHPTLKSAYADVEEAKAQNRVARAAYYPNVDFVLSASRNKDLDGLTGINNDQMAMFNVRYNVFRGGADHARDLETAYLVQEAYEVKNRTMLQVEESTRLSWDALVASRKRVEHLRKYKNSARKTLNAYREQFKVGKRSLLDLLDSQNEYYKANLEYVDAEYSRHVAKYRLLASMGRLVTYANACLPTDVMNADDINRPVLDFAENQQLNFAQAQPQLDAAKPAEVAVAAADKANISKVSDANKTIVAATDKANVVKAANANSVVANNAKSQMHTAKLDKPIPTKQQHMAQAGARQWIIQAGAFSQRDNAEKLLKHLKSEGFAAFIEGDRLYKVFTGPYAQRLDADTNLARLEQVSEIHGYLTSRNMAKNDSAIA